MFRIFDASIADSEVLEYRKMKTGETAVFGEALKLTDTGLTKCAATDAVQYICRGTLQEDGSIPVGVVMQSTRYAVPYTAKPTVATKVTLHTDGLQVTNTSASGVFLVLDIDEKQGIAIGKFAV